MSFALFLLLIDLPHLMFYHKLSNHVTGIRSDELIFNPRSQHLTVGVKGQPPIIDGEVEKEMKVEESTWCLLDRKVILLNIEKVGHFGCRSLRRHRSVR